MAPLLRLFLLANALSCTLSSPVPYTTEDFNTSLGENDMKNIEQQRADGIDEVRSFDLTILLSLDMGILDAESDLLHNASRCYQLLHY